MKQFNVDGPVTVTEDGDFLYKSDVHLVLLRKKNKLQGDLEYLEVWVAENDFKRDKRAEITEKIRLIDSIIKDLGLN